MARNVKIDSRAKRVTALALLSLTVAIPSGVLVSRAGAGWLPATAQSRNTGPVQITSNRIVGLTPGAKRTLVLTLRNRNAKRPVEVRRIRVRVVRTTKRACAPKPRNLRIRQPHTPRFTLQPRDTRHVRALLTMPNTVVQACQGVVFSLRYSAETQ